MEGNIDGGGNQVVTMHVKTEAADESPSALGLGSLESPASCGDAACRGGGGVGQTAEELADTEFQANTSNTPVLLYPVSTERFFTTSADGKTYLKIAPATMMPPGSSEKTLSSGSDFSSKAVLCLIEAVGRRWSLYETRERSQLFQSVQEEMASKGHVLPVEKIRRKWNNLIVTYKRVKDRGRETGHAKTSWEFFDLMDATLCDTIGTQISNNKRNKAASTPPGPLTKIVAKSGLHPQPSIVCPNSDLTTSGGVEPVSLGVASSQIINSTVANTSATISPTGASDLKPLIVLSADIVTTSIQPASVVPAPSFISSPCFTETTSTSPSLGLTGCTDLNTSGYSNRKTSSFTSNVIPFRLNATPLNHSQNVLGMSSFSPTTSCLSSSIPASLSATSLPGIEGQNQRGNREQSSIPLFQEILKRQEEQAYLDRVAQRRVEAREKRRERREVRMSESLGRIATALELLSSKQDTVIALLQRLADRK